MSTLRVEHRHGGLSGQKPFLPAFFAISNDSLPFVSFRKPTCV
jgi:hypothetical protein